MQLVSCLGKTHLKTSGIVGHAAAIHFLCHLKLFKSQCSLKSSFKKKKIVFTSLYLIWMREEFQAVFFFA